MDTETELTTQLLSPSEKDHETSAAAKPSVQRWIVPLVTFLLGLLLSLILYLTHSPSHPQALSPIPTFPTEQRVFEWNYTFTSVRTPESERAWRSLLPFGRGYFLLEDPKRYSIPEDQGDPTPRGNVYSVALYHQLHCLSVIRRDYFDLVDAILAAAEADEADGEEGLNELKEIVEKQVKLVHTGHCLDYLRQSIECTADMTVEWKRTEEDGSRVQVDGMGIPHVCRRKESVEGWMREQRKLVKEARGRGG